MGRSNAPLWADLSLARLTCARRLFLTSLNQNKLFYKVHLAHMGLIIMMLTLLIHENKSYDLKTLEA